MRNLRIGMSVTALALALAFAGCGQADESASLTITSVPQAEVFVDGVAHGTTGQTLTLAAGEHKVELKVDGFKTFETTVSLAAGESRPIEASLDSLDPSAPTVVAKLMESEGIEMAPWVAPETTRGHSSKKSPAVLLWPARDVRKDGLVNFAIEADESYGGDATLEFRSGRKVLFRQAFNPEQITTVRPIPAEVLEHVKVNSKITWGLYFEDSRRPITAMFKVVRRPKAERQLERLRTSRHMQRQPEITRKIAAAVVLENNRLYSEALVANLRIATEHEGSTQPFRGIVTTLRRLDAEHSELFATVTPFVSGKGGHGLEARGAGLGVSAWSPVQSGALPTPVAPEATGTAKGMGPGGAGLTPTGGDTTTPEGAVPTPEQGDEGAKVEADRLAAEALARERMNAMSAERDQLAELAAEASKSAEEAAQAAEQAEADAARAEAEATAAREAVETAEEPTREQQERMAETGSAAEEAREAAANARQAAEEARVHARELDDKLVAANNKIADLQRVLDTDAGKLPTADEARGPSADDLQQAVTTAEDNARDAEAGYAQAQADLEAADKARIENPSEAADQAFRDAQAALENAAKVKSEADVALSKAQAALSALGQQVKPAIK